MSKVIQSVYANDSSHLDAGVGSNSSYFWLGVLWSRELLRLGLHKGVGNGASIDFRGYVESLPSG